MIGLWLACVAPFPDTRPAAEGDADTDTDVDADTDADTDPEPVVLQLDQVAEAGIVGAWLPAGAVQADADPALELLLSRPWQSESDLAAWGLYQPEGVVLAPLPGAGQVVPPKGACLSDLAPTDYEGVAGADGRDLDGDGLGDLVLGLPTRTHGGSVDVILSAGLPLGPSSPTTVFCHPGDERFAWSVRTVADAGFGPAALAAIRSGVGNDTAGVAILPLDALDGSEVDALASSVAWVTLHSVLQGASLGGAVGAVDFDGDGVSAVLVGTEGDAYDPPRVYLLEQGVQGKIDGDLASLALDARVSGSAPGPTPCGPATIEAFDLDGDGADELVLGFSGDDRVAVVAEPDLAAELIAADRPGASGPGGTCFGVALATAGEGLLAIGAPGESRVYGVPGSDLAAGAVDVAAGDYVFVLEGDGYNVGAALVGADLDGEDGSDLAVGETGTAGVYLVSGSTF